MSINKYKAYHLCDVFQIVSDIGKKNQIANNVPPVLWARGHERISYNLKPTLLRYIDLDSFYNNTSSKRAVGEELRKEYYIAKNYHFFTDVPRTSIEWMEVMQHHGTYTRLLDWSESIIHSLLFALECFFNKEKYNNQDRMDAMPCLWILNPIKWNEVCYDQIFYDKKLLESVLDDLPKGLKEKILFRLEKAVGTMQDYLDIQETSHLKGIFNFSSIMSDFQSMSDRELFYLLEKGELFNCILYVLVRIYCYSQTQKINKVLPVSIVEPYHSERIRAQRGVFTLFPYYEEDGKFNAAKYFQLPLDAMEYMNQANCYLYRILLCNPEEIAFELMNSGANISWLYQEMPVVSNAIEERKIHTIV